MKNMLPVVEPPIYNYLSHACYLSAILSNPNTYNWLYSNYIDLCLEHNKKNIIKTDFYCGDQGWYITYLGFIKHQKIHKKFISKHNVKVSELIKSSINSENYVITYLDEFFIEQKSSYKRNHYSHRFLIRGYDDLTETFFTGTWKGENNGFNTEFKIPYSNFEKAFLATLDEKDLSFNSNCVVLFSCSKMSFEYIIDYKSIYNSVFSYLESKNLLYKNGLYFNTYNNERFIFGLQIHDFLWENLKNLNYGNNTVTNFLPYFTLFQHKQLMQKRIYFLNNICTDNYIHESYIKYSEVVKMTSKCNNMILKVLLTKSSINVNSIVLLLKEIKKREMVALNLLLNHLLNKL